VQGRRKEWGGECKETETPGVGVAVGGRRGWGRAAEEVLGLASEDATRAAD
jgi:hypothetical protein